MNATYTSILCEPKGRSRRVRGDGLEICGGHSLAREGDPEEAPLECESLGGEGRSIPSETALANENWPS
jgi:hypothetical protein